jgi:hypothetical protein
MENGRGISVSRTNDWVSATEVPVLLIVWRRPEHLRQVIGALRQVKPQKVYVACDGPNPSRPGEREKVSLVQRVIDTEVDWSCQIFKRYHSENIGCRNSVIHAIDWFLDEVGEGIILEDDCVPSPDFFRYCSELLSRFRHDTRIWSICGSNFQLGNRRGDADYYFSIHGDSWGWATWKRAWNHFHAAEEGWQQYRDSGVMHNVLTDPHERRYWTAIMDDLFVRGIPDAWDYQWWLAGWMNHALHIWPNSSLISNIGFGPDATHTFTRTLFSELPTDAIEVLTHPRFILPDRAADRFAFLHRRHGQEQIDRARFGLIYPLVRRLRTARSEGLGNYIKRNMSRLKSKVVVPLQEKCTS